jgi:hypothetical protein
VFKKDYYQKPLISQTSSSLAILNYAFLRNIALSLAIAIIQDGLELMATRFLALAYDLQGRCTLSFGNTSQ